MALRKILISTALINATYHATALKPRVPTSLELSLSASERLVNDDHFPSELRREKRTPIIKSRGGAVSTTIDVRGGANTLASQTAEELEFRKALVRVALTVTASCLFGLGIYAVRGRQSAMEFFAGYLVEQSLSVDNIFVFVLLFDFFKVPVELQPRALKWGIMGAVVMRAVMISVGVAAIKRFRSIVLLFAGILMVSAWKLFFEGSGGEEEQDLGDNPLVKVANWMCPAVDYFDGNKFFTTVNGVKRATPLLLCVVCIELSDFVFAVDSIPAVLSISQDQLIVLSSNIFAIMGLRSLYTLVARAVQDLPYLRPAVALILFFVGVKMLLEYFHVTIPTEVSLGIIALLLGSGVGLSLLAKSAKENRKR